MVFLRRAQGAAEGGEWPDLSDAALAANVSDWLEPVLMFKTSLGEVSIDELETALAPLLPSAAVTLLMASVGSGAESSKP